MPQTPTTAADHTALRTGQGVSVERRFTQAGVHPFDAIEWEIRDAIIGDPENPAFEQRDVEFPKSWSQNATNIVAQKYFRGQLESPTRERSVKQMIGRVAGTIAAWGREGAYFATHADAEACGLSSNPTLNQTGELKAACWLARMCVSSASKASAASDEAK